MAIQETSFGPKQYLTLKKSIPISQISDKQMYDDAGKKLGAYIHAHGVRVTGPWSVLYFTWDQANQKTDIGIAFPVEQLDTISDPELSMVIIPECSAAMDSLHGSYEGLSTIHQSLMQYTSEKGYSGGSLPVIAVEEYEVDPKSDSEPSHWKTNIYYLHN